ncbi:hypothetical protein [Aureivirga sp. CE67]|uniref:hypothetical protein n=1 Tax=Aureivirga sp. CE67 TaxID=1788983 RepID=UPI0018C938E0|nr:hypothetical protein [Aureivirga sp. CE67]
MKKLFIVFTLEIIFISCTNSKEQHLPVEGRWIKGSEQEKIKIIEKQFRGLDKAMVEIGYRYQELYWGGQDKNWDYANYQLKKIKKALKLGLQRRPNRAKSAEHFLNNVIPEMKKAIDAKDKNLFNEKIEFMRNSCTACHAYAGEESYPSFKVGIPTDRQSPIR